jgi:rhamnose utilization protein RhaD (predicted bifunctional aldolase and dehydrogenase)/NAD(P)-dependent dehydrogenase (short-subunit alcohol dehydrogenase family)
MNQPYHIPPNADPVETLVTLSRFFGSDPEIVLAGGGNTSVKLGNVLHVKASGSSLATIDKSGFVLMNREQLEAIANAEYPTDREQREERYKNALYAARIEPARNQRPSVEALLHHIVPQKFVVHSHATVVNTLTCHTKGETLAKQLFGSEAMWLPFIDPGYLLARELKKALTAHTKATGTPPKIILMGNHGLIISSDDPNEIYTLTKRVIDTVSSKLGANWEQAFGPATKAPYSVSAINVIAPALRALLAETPAALKVVTLDDSDLALSFASSPAARDAAAAGPLTPDQIVYCNSFPAFFDYHEGEAAKDTIARLRTALTEHQSRSGYPAKVVLVPGVGLFAIGDDARSAFTTRDLYLDSVKVMAGAKALGGISHQTAEQRKFIEEWEVEAYRKQIARGSAVAGRASGKIAVVTGAAQGFGLEIATDFAAQGGHVVLTDMNIAGATEAARAISAKFGAGKAAAFQVNVTSGESTADAFHNVVRIYGGFDVVVSNAGVLRAESVKTQSEKDFDFVTSVNYKGYFIVTQKAAPTLAIQRQAAGVGYFSDIIQINSKSGLQGSNKNGAYAGSKFGGIGLTQSFAMELIEDGIKVNSICPGNFFDGPLWSDPNNGLFVQYLRTGKVPGAKTVEDVKKFYEAKVPMGRGCRTADVMKAIYYLMDQQYETGQALPVSGGQVMLK